MKLELALQQPNGQVVPSLKVMIIGCHGSKTIANGKTMTSFTIKEGNSPVVMLRFISISKVTFFSGCYYHFQSVPTESGMKGIEVHKWNETTTIDCNETVHYEIIDNPELNNKTEHMSEPAQPVAVEPRAQLAAPLTKDQIITYYLSVYFKTKTMALTKEISDEEASKVGLKMMEIIPQSWFGEKNHPL